MPKRFLGILWKSASVALGVAGLVAGVLIGRARASGTPAAPNLWYSGTIQSVDGQALSGNHNVEVRFWAAADGGTTSECSNLGAGVVPADGRFTVSLPSTCTDAIRNKRDVWVEVVLDGASLGRTKLGVVPYAVEASHAVQADSAVTDFSVPNKLTVGAGIDGNGNVSIMGTSGQRATTVGVTGCEPATTYAGLSVQGSMTNCTEYSLLGDGSNLFVNRPGGQILFRNKNATEMVLSSGGRFQLMSGTNPINFTEVWTGTPDSTKNVAEISNDIGTYQTLMLVGNKSAGLGRRVSVWDRFEVNGTFVNNSSRASKQDIRALTKDDYSHMLDTLESTTVYHYRFKAPGIDRKQRIGVIAEESPAEIVDETGKAVSMLDYAGFLLATVKAQQAQIRALRADVEALKRKTRN